MKTKFFAVVAALALAATSLFAADNTAFQTEFQSLVEDIRGQLAAGKNTEKDLADELKRFEALLDKHRAEKSDEVAQAAIMYATLYMQIGNTEKAIEGVKRVKTDFPESAPAKEADRIIAMMEKQSAAKEIQSKLAVGSQFPEFNVQDLSGKPLALSDYKGKVTLIDFWATWCGPCIAELPHVIEAYEKHHDKGFEIIGISLDQESDREKLVTFT